MLALRTLPIALLLLFVHLAAFTTTTEDGAAAETTTAGRLVIRRRLPARHGGAGRLSLTNSRFGGRGGGPRRRDPAQLRRLLGDHFEPRFMAVDRPADMEAMLVDAEGAGGGSRQQALRKARTGNLSAELERIAGRWMDPVIVKSVETWMLEKSACPVRYAWEDIGALFWPRWIRRGECASVPGTCSWPPGMHCVPSATSTLNVLRWQCKVPKGSRRKTTAWPRRLSPDSPDPQGLKCSWIRVPYPITSGCMCTC